ncbi:DUF1194 domain-containing protein [uncultured Roseibium sp.]|uniref:DUF1194 domain-containing protein n=1 Tax=uncultured Roseibium sp. TaxID=1936171 RepID=UPI00262909F0|nr:DUF1194 domain-containing protein [uncultured Roseibium sp.]
MNKLVCRTCGLMLMLSAFSTLPATACSLSLVLAMDGSSSVDHLEHDLQLNGLANALSDPEVVQAIEAVGGIWVMSFEWSGQRQHFLQFGWQFLEDTASAEKAASTLREARRGFIGFPTAIGYALGYAAVQMSRAPEPCARKVIDVAGDGINNDGFPPSSAYKAFDFEGVTVNGLVIAGEDTSPIQYYRQHVISGPGAFIEIAEDYNDYARAMKRKLIREIMGNGYASTR